MYGQVISLSLIMFMLYEPLSDSGILNLYVQKCINQPINRIKLRFVSLVLSYLFLLSCLLFNSFFINFLLNLFFFVHYGSFVPFSFIFTVAAFFICFFFFWIHNKKIIFILILLFSYLSRRKCFHAHFLLQNYFFKSNKTNT